VNRELWTVNRKFWTLSFEPWTVNIACEIEIVPGPGVEAGKGIHPHRAIGTARGGIQIVAGPAQQSRDATRHQQKRFLPPAQRRASATAAQDERERWDLVGKAGKRKAKSGNWWCRMSGLSSNSNCSLTQRTQRTQRRLFTGFTQIDPRPQTPAPAPRLKSGSQIPTECRAKTDKV